MEVSNVMWAFDSSKLHLVSAYFILNILYNFSSKNSRQETTLGTQFIGKRDIKMNLKRYCVRVLTGYS
jgi:hypothetical protein